MILNFWKPVLWLIIVSTISLIPGNDIPSQILLFPNFDKVIHFGMYFVLVLFLVFPLLKIKAVNTYLIAFLIAVLLGGILEILQATIAINRTGSYIDFLANLSGAIFGLIVYKWIISGKKVEVIFKA